MDGCVGYVSVVFRVVYLQCPAVFLNTSPHRRVTLSASSFRTPVSLLVQSGVMEAVVYER